MGISGSPLSSCSFIYCHKGGYTSIEEPNSIWPDWFNFVPALSSVLLSKTPPVASVHYLQHWLYVVVECSHISFKRGPQSRALPLVGPIPCIILTRAQTQNWQSPMPPISTPPVETLNFGGPHRTPSTPVSSSPPKENLPPPGIRCLAPLYKFQ